MTTPVPCGKCAQCKRAKLKAWLFRFEKELDVSYNPFFITLTYSTPNLTYSDAGATLVKSDVQLFMKRLRHHWNKDQDNTHEKPLKYYAVGEYGSKKNRPHYHIILFNLTSKNAQKLIHDTWGMGITETSPITSTKSILYTLKYITTKKSRKKRR